jgi:hypothetical protein
VRARRLVVLATALESGKNALQEDLGRP